MKNLIITTSLACLMTLGCTPYPRYHSRTTTHAVAAPTHRGGYTTNDFLKLGRILRSYLGRPYVGRSRYERGIDCSLFLKEVYDKFDGRALPRTVAEQHRLGREIHRRHLYFGDLLFFRTNHQAVSHVGIFLDSDRFMHASTSNGVIISSLKEEYWAKRYVGARRILEKTPPQESP